LRELQEIAWVLLGVMLGTGTCFVLVDQPPSSISGSILPLASMTVFAMLASSVHSDCKPSGVLH